MVVAKLGSSPKAAANSFKVSKVVGEESIKFVILMVTNSSVANFLLPLSLFVPLVLPVYTSPANQASPFSAFKV
jgi:hypothetical protein